VAVVAVGGDHLVALLERHLHADDDGFLPDIEVAEPADEAHAVKLAGLLLEAADQQHVPCQPNQPISAQQPQNTSTSKSFGFLNIVGGPLPSASVITLALAWLTGC
jgi:hypothetical protein